MLFKVDTGFYLNTKHIIAVHNAQCVEDGSYQISLEYTPHSQQACGLFKKVFDKKSEADRFLHSLNKALDA